MSDPFDEVYAVLDKHARRFSDAGGKIEISFMRAAPDRIAVTFKVLDYSNPANEVVRTITRSQPHGPAGESEQLLTDLVDHVTPKR